MGNVESSSAEPGKNDKYIEEQKRIIKAQQEQIRKLSEMNQQNPSQQFPSQQFPSQQFPSQQFPSQHIKESSNRPKLDPYKVLGIGKQYDENSLKKAYLKMALQTHPDRGGTEEKFQIVTLSFNVLFKKLQNKNNNHEHHELKENSDVFMKEQKEDITIHQDLSKKFDSNIFNQIYDENRIEQVHDKGYTSWIKENQVDEGGPKDIFQGNFNKERFEEEFQKQKQTQQKKISDQLVKYDEPNVDISYKGKDSIMVLGEGEIKDFSGESSGGLVYRDYRDAYTNTLLIDVNSVDTRGRAKDIHTQKSIRKNISYELSEDDQRKEALKLKEEEKAEELRLQRLKDFEEKSFQTYDRIHQRLLGK
tara:strand:+ start:644 stop:1729 length:1086 start_codon:yes stop_codon:yes gene_type:complete